MFSGECVTPMGCDAGADRPAEGVCRAAADNPAPFSALARNGQHAVVGSSPGGLVRVVDGWADAADCRHPSRVRRPVEDAALRQRLIDNAKGAPRHIMRIDLGAMTWGASACRARWRSTELMAVASYSHVHHIESNVRAQAP